MQSYQQVQLTFIVTFLSAEQRSNQSFSLSIPSWIRPSFLASWNDAHSVNSAQKFMPFCYKVSGYWWRLWKDLVKLPCFFPWSFLLFNSLGGKNCCIGNETVANKNMNTTESTPNKRSAFTGCVIWNWSKSLYEDFALIEGFLWVYLL